MCLEQNVWLYLRDSALCIGILNGIKNFGVSSVLNMTRTGDVHCLYRCRFTAESSRILSGISWHCLMAGHSQVVSVWQSTSVQMTSSVFARRSLVDTWRHWWTQWTVIRHWCGHGPLLKTTCSFKPERHYFNLLWTCWATSRTTSCTTSFV